MTTKELTPKVLHTMKNKLRKLIKHQKRQPNDRVALKAIAELHKQGITVK